MATLEPSVLVRVCPWSMDTGWRDLHVPCWSVSVRGPWTPMARLARSVLVRVCPRSINGDLHMRKLVSAWTAAAALVLAGSIYVTAQEPRPQPPAGGRGGPPAAAAAAEGKKIWALECINCHGTNARGTDNGPNLVRSLVVLRDRFGSALGPFLKQGHKMQSGRPSAALTDDQVLMLAHFLRDRVNDTLRGSSEFEVKNILTGDAKAGEAYFTGEGKCSTCHSPSGDLRGLGGKYEPVDIQQRFLFPRNASSRGGRGRGRGSAPSPATAITVTVTPPNGPP